MEDTDSDVLRELGKLKREFDTELVELRAKQAQVIANFEKRITAQKAGDIRRELEKS